MPSKRYTIPISNQIYLLLDHNDQSSIVKNEQKNSFLQIVQHDPTGHDQLLYTKLYNSNTYPDAKKKALEICHNYAVKQKNIWSHICESTTPERIKALCETK